MPIDDHLLPDGQIAVQRFTECGGQLTCFSPFGHDPLHNDSNLTARRESLFQERYPNFQPFFSTVVNGDYGLFREGLLFFIELSKRLESN